MVDETLIAYLESKLEISSNVQTRLPSLLAYNNEPDQFNEEEEQTLITAIDTIKVLDPACGSGAFPMGVLHILVFILNKLDPRNECYNCASSGRLGSARFTRNFLASTFLCPLAESTPTPAPLTHSVRRLGKIETHYHLILA